MKLLRIGCLLCGFLSLVLSASAQTLTTLHAFDMTDGASSFAGLVQATNGSFYSTTLGGGTFGYGTVYKITPGGTLTTLHDFDYSDGRQSRAALIQATNGTLYATTTSGGANNEGEVFKITPGGTLTTLHSFCTVVCSDGAIPYSGLVQATNGAFYGTTSIGGASGNYGTVYKITASGALTTLHSFDNTDGSSPYEGLVQATNGDLYGTTTGGGAHASGTVFKITLSGTLTTIYSFCALTNCADGSQPYASLIQATDGNLYGTTQAGGNSVDGGTVFKITPSGTLTTLYNFCSQTNCTDGGNPQTGLVQGSDGNFYGTATYDGVNSGGTIFEITPSGTFTTLYSLCSPPNCADGSTPLGTLIQGTDGSFYGTTHYGGDPNFNVGTIFSLSVGLGPFVETMPTSGRVGTAVKILGTNLTGATSVTFNGTAATFTVVSASEITTTVPTGATTGKLKVVTPGGALNSNVKFRVSP